MFYSSKIHLPISVDSVLEWPYQFQSQAVTISVKFCILYISIMQPNQYDFIMQSPTPPKKSLFSAGSQKTRILQIVVLGAIVLVVGLLAISFVSKLGKSNTTNLYKLAAAQEDMIDITGNYAASIKSDALAKKAATLNAILLSQNRETLTALSKAGAKKPTKQIALYKVSSYKKVLDEAKTKGTYEDAYSTLLSNRVDDYRAKLQNAFSGSKGAYKNSLASYYQQLKLLYPLPEDKVTPTPSATPTKVN